MTRIYTAAALGLICSAALLGSCREKEDDNADAGYASGQAALEKTFSDVQRIADEAASGSVGGREGLTLTGFEASAYECPASDEPYDAGR